MVRSSAYLVLGWLLIAVVGGLADVLDITVMLPATTAVVVTHCAFCRGQSVPAGLAVAVALGYLEDLHQGAPVGTLSLAYALSFLVLRWASARLHVGGMVLRALASFVAVLLIDVMTYGILFALADPLGLRRDALLSGLAAVRWHGIATLLVAPPVWGLIDRVLALLKVDDKPQSQLHWGKR